MSEVLVYQSKVSSSKLINIYQVDDNRYIHEIVENNKISKRKVFKLTSSSLEKLYKSIK